MGSEGAVVLVCFVCVGGAGGTSAQLSSVQQHYFFALSLQMKTCRFLALSSFFLTSAFRMGSRFFSKDFASDMNGQSQREPKRLELGETQQRSHAGLSWVLDDDLELSKVL